MSSCGKNFPYFRFGALSGAQGDMQFLFFEIFLVYKVFHFVFLPKRNGRQYLHMKIVT